jgi:hypothetical protein
LPQRLTVADREPLPPAGPDNGSPEEDSIVHYGGVIV